MSRRLSKSRIFYRLAEVFMPLLVWLTITLPLWLSPFHPAVVSYFILGFLLYFLYKSGKTVYYAALSYKLMRKLERINWLKKVKKIKGFDKLVHYIIITNYKESKEKLEKTLEYIKKQDFPKEKIFIVLAMEEFEGEPAFKRACFLENKFKKYFAGFFSVFHRLSAGEVKGKASNEAFAGRWIFKKIQKEKILPENVLITVCDADSLLPKNYLSYLSYQYLKDKDRIYHFYWAPVLLYSNFWQLPLFIRVQAILSSILRLAFLSQKNDLIQISTYSVSLWLLQKVGFWDTDVIPEDWHIWLQAFFKFGEKVRTIPLYTPIQADAVLAKNFWETCKNRYLQERRWAWGVSDIAYALRRFFETPHISSFLKLQKILLLFETHFLWPTSFFILTLSGYIPSLVNPVFKRTVLGFILPKLASFILTLSSLFLIFILYFDWKIREKIGIRTKPYHLPLLFIQWYFLPLISFLFSSLPALDAHTRLLIGKKIEYQVTEKI